MSEEDLSDDDTKIVKEKRMKDTVKIFISYAHQDKGYVDNFEKHICPIKQKYSLEIFRDLQINVGEEFKSKIDDELDKSDIVLLFLSANFLASSACEKEKKQSLELRNKRSIVVIPIILSTCQWKETELKNFLAMPEDGKPIDDFEDKNKAWDCVIDSLKKSVEKVKHIKEIQIKEEFKKFLQDTESLTKTHHNKNEVLLDNIFIAPELECYDETRKRESEEYIEYQKLEDNILEYKNIVIAGEDQSGKTTLCKKLFLALRKKGWLPVYVFDKDKKMQGIITNRVHESFKKQYDIPQEVKYEELANRIIPIIDNFHLAIEKEKHIKNLSEYSFSILVLDDIFDLDIENKNIVKIFKHFKIKEFSPSLRDKLIKKWLSLKEINDSETYKELDEKTEQVDTTLGKIINKGIVPSYPFFIVTILMAYETANPLDENITSQGHCYQALIYIALRKKIQNKDIDTYLNFLTMIAYEFFKSEKREFTQDEMTVFTEEYKKQYNLPQKIEEKLLSNLQGVKILGKNSFNNNISFIYDYLYYYFVAKHIAENINENKKIIDNIMKNLHKNENAYIAVFIVHHSKSNYVLDEIFLNSLCLFDTCHSVTFKKDEVLFLTDKVKYIAEAALPKTNETTKNDRKRKLEKKDEIEKSQEDEEELDTEHESNHLSIEIRRSIKTVEVMGSIIKNRSGSLDKKRLKELFEAGMNVHFRLLKSFLEIIKEDKLQKFMIDWINSKLQKVLETPDKKITQDKLKELSEKIFWNLNFGVLYGYINKIVHTLGSDNLMGIINEVCDEINTPASFLVQHGVSLWYSKDLQVDNIVKKIEEKTFSDSNIAKIFIKYMIVNHCAMHPIKAKERQKLETKLGFSEKKLLEVNLKTKRNN